MALNKLTPTLYTLDLEATINFYLDILGFVCLSYQPDWGWANLQIDDINLMISKPNDHIVFDKPFFTGSFYFTTDDVDSIWNRINKHVQICYPIEEFYYGMREFGVYDNNGYLLQFGQPIAGN